MYFYINKMLNQLYINENDLNFNDRTFKTILKDIYNDPCKVAQLSMSDIEEIMELTDTEIKLKKDIVVIYYYSEIRLIGYNETTNCFEIFNLPVDFEMILRNIGYFSFYESNIMSLLKSEYVKIDYYYSEEGYTFDNNNHIMYYIIP